MRMSATEWILFILVIIGGLNWGLVGLFEFNLVEELIGNDTVERVIYSLVGLATVGLLVTHMMRADVGDRDV